MQTKFFYTLSVSCFADLTIPVCVYFSNGLLTFLPALSPLTASRSPLLLNPLLPLPRRLLSLHLPPFLSYPYCLSILFRYTILSSPVNSLLSSHLCIPSLCILTSHCSPTRLLPLQPPLSSEPQLPPCSTATNTAQIRF